ncbi:MAG TPA: SDR family NAD(P)-dependent oxidoreductase, partial [Pirellulaceae bacterium]
MPTVFLTAHYALLELARVRRGERILIHAAAGGVGQAAVQIAQDLGLEIFATVGSAEKRKFLNELGVRHVMSSRSLDFADEIMRITDGQGVDVVLNSLAGPFIPKSLSVLAPFGRFLEIGKVDVYNNTRLGLEGFKHNISYHVIDLAECLMWRTELVASMFAALAEKLATGTYRPLSHQVFPITEVVEAFRFMAQGQHMGKNVLDFDVAEIPIGPCTQEGHLFRSDASYLITGGAGGFGLEIAKWMSQQGARHLVLMSRSGPRDPEASRSIAALRAQGINVRDARGDVTRPGDVRRVLREIQAAGPPLIGIFHGAMVLEDGFIAELPEIQFNRVMQPKMLGAWNLHVESRDLPLEHFVCFSSFSAVAGGARQSNYNSGNVFLDHLAHYRRGLGLPGLTINWGSISGAGFVHRNQNITEYFDKIGFHSITVNEALQVLRDLLPCDPGQVGVARIDWKGMERYSPFVAGSNMFAPLVQETATDGGGASARPRILAASSDDRPGMVRTLLSDQLAAVCGIEVSKVDPNISIMKLGLDSLMAIELINRVENELGLVLPMGKVLAGPTLTELSETVVQILAYTVDENAAAAGVVGGDKGPRAVIAALDARAVESPLSETQLAHWFEFQQDPQGANHVGIAARVTPAPQVDRLRDAFRILRGRHPSLWVEISNQRGEPTQRPIADTKATFLVHPPATREPHSWTRCLSDRFRHRLDITRGDTLRLEVFPSQEDSLTLMLVAHRIVADTWTMRDLLEELFAIHDALATGIEPDEATAGISAASYVAWEREQLAGDSARQALNFWTEPLGAIPAALDWPSGKLSPTGSSPRTASRTFQGDSVLSHRLLLLSAEQGVPPEVILLSALELLLHRWCQRDDLMIAYEIAGRDNEQLQSARGCFARFVPLRSTLEGELTFLDVLHRNRQLLADGETHARFSLSQLLSEPQIPRAANRPPLCQVAFSMHRRPDIDPQGLAVHGLGRQGHRVQLGPFAVDSLEWGHGDSPFELALDVEEAGGAIFGRWRCRTDRVSEEALADLQGQWLELLQQLTADPLSPLTAWRIPSRPAPVESQVPAVPSKPVAAERSAFVAPQGEIEHLVARVWEEILDVRPVGSRDDFFSLGGHSLKAALVAARLGRMFSVDVPGSVVWAAPTVAALAQWIDT